MGFHPHPSLPPSRGKEFTARLLSHSCYIQQRIIHEMLKYIPLSAPEGERIREGDYKPLPPSRGKAGMGVKCPSYLLRTLGELANQPHRRMIGECFLKSLSPLICLVVGLLNRADRAVSVQINDGSGIQVGHGDGGWRGDHARRARRMRHMQVSVNNLRVRLRARNYPIFRSSGVRITR